MYNKYFKIKKTPEKDRGFFIIESSKNSSKEKYNVLLYENRQNIANVIIFLDESIEELSEELRIKEIREYLENSFEELKSLPRLSKVSKLLQKCYDDGLVENFKKNIKHNISFKEWFSPENQKNFTSSDLDVLTKEKEKYNLGHDLIINNPTYIHSNILNWILQNPERATIVSFDEKFLTRFNDDRNLYKDLAGKGEMLMYNKYFKLDYDLKKDKGFKILNSWERDYGDIEYNVLLYENRQNIANVIICMDDSIEELSKEEQIKEIREYLENSFEELKSLPKLSKTSKLMQEMVDSVCVSEAQMCHVTNEDWFYYKETYNDIDLKSLKKEVEKYNLSNYLQVGSSTEEYVIVGYGDLPTLFNDDRSLSKELIEIESDTIQQSIQDEEDKKEDYGMEK